MLYIVTILKRHTTRIRKRPNEKQVRVVYGHLESLDTIVSTYRFRLYLRS